MNVEFANFVCHFGNLNMLDGFVEFIYPAVTSGLPRTYGDSKMFFYESRLLQIEINNSDERHAFLYGKFVKDTFIQREQIYTEGKLQADNESFQNSPSSIFIISLYDHRMFYIKEHKDSPNILSFKSTMEHLVNSQIINARNEEYARLIEMHNEYPDRIRKPKRSDMEVKFPSMDLEIIQLSSDAGIEEFINDLKSIEKLSLGLVMPNDETDTNDFFEQWRAKKKNLNAAKSKIDFSKKGKTLPHSEVIDIAKEAVSDGNILINLKGTDINNDKINGTNENFKLTASLGELEDTPEGTTAKIYSIFRELKSSGIIRESRVKEPQKVLKKVLDIIGAISTRDKLDESKNNRNN